MLRRNGHLTVEREGSDYLNGLGERARRFAGKWEIARTAEAMPAVR